MADLFSSLIISSIILFDWVIGFFMHYRRGLGQNSKGEARRLLLETEEQSEYLKERRVISELFKRRLRGQEKDLQASLRSRAVVLFGSSWVCLILAFIANELQWNGAFLIPSDGAFWMYFVIDVISVLQLIVVIDMHLRKILVLRNKIQSQVDFYRRNNEKLNVTILDVLGSYFRSSRNSLLLFIFEIVVLFVSPVPFYPQQVSICFTMFLFLRILRWGVKWFDIQQKYKFEKLKQQQGKELPFFFRFL